MALTDDPEVLQFGTGGFLRGFADYFIQQAVKAGSLSGGVVLVGSTGSGRIGDFDEQDGLYTLLVRGRESGRPVDEYEVVSVVNRALAAKDHWTEVLNAACGPSMQLVISNTTEVGIVLDESDRLDANPPRTFPGKLTAILYERARAFEFDCSRGLIILPCELIEKNGDTLKAIVRSLATEWRLGPEFASWLEEANTFCNTLVDRIVPGTPRGSVAADIEQRLGYHDALLTVAEPYRLWAIEGDEALARRLPLTGVDRGIVVATDIEPFRERKVRILNGTHTAMVPAAILAGLDTVRDTVQDIVFKQFIERIAIGEIVPTLESDADDALDFARDVIERFENPFIRHELIDITFQQTKKLRVRVLPTILAHLERFGSLPGSVMLGLAACILYSDPSSRIGQRRLASDDARAAWETAWSGRSAHDEADVRFVVQTIMGSESIWGLRLNSLPGLVDSLVESVLAFRRSGIRAVLESHVHAIER